MVRWNNKDWARKRRKKRNLKNYCKCFPLSYLHIYTIPTNFCVCLLYSSYNYFIWFHSIHSNQIVVYAMKKSKVSSEKEIFQRIEYNQFEHKKNWKTSYDYARNTVILKQKNSNSIKFLKKQLFFFKCIVVHKIVYFSEFLINLTNLSRFTDILKHLSFKSHMKCYYFLFVHIFLCIKLNLNK